jgi:hypothetical protein
MRLLLVINLPLDPNNFVEEAIFRYDKMFFSKIYSSVPTILRKEHPLIDKTTHDVRARMLVLLKQGP